MATVRNGLVRISRAWRALDVEQRRAGVAALALLVTMFLPWYEKSYFEDGKAVSDSISAFGVVSFIEAAIFLVSLGVLLLLFFRAEQRAFHLPGGDGTVIFGAGVWAAFLLFWRVFDKPDLEGDAATIGIQWGFFLAFVAAGVLAYVGFRLRTSHQIAEPTRAQDPTTKVEPAPLPPRHEITFTNERRRRRPASGRSAGPDSPTQIAGQLSFEESQDDPPTERR